MDKILEGNLLIEKHTGAHGKYHSDWNALMPVVFNILHAEASDIEMMGDGYIGSGFNVHLLNDNIRTHQCQSEQGREIEAVWSVVVDYFKKKEK